MNLKTNLPVWAKYGLSGLKVLLIIEVIGAVIFLWAGSGIGGVVMPLFIFGQILALVFDFSRNSMFFGDSSYFYTIKPLGWVLTVLFALAVFFAFGVIAGTIRNKWRHN